MKEAMTLRSPKPRNPLVAAARFRRAGAHDARRAADRQRARGELQAELARYRTQAP